MAVSDLHGLYESVTIPKCDVLVVAGDILGFNSTEKDYVAFNNWLKKQPVEHRLVIAGNHDSLLQKSGLNRCRELLDSATYLQDSGIQICGLRFWGSPWIPKPARGAFVDYDSHLGDYWMKIPQDTQVLITHTPPFGYLDMNLEKQHRGSQTLANKLHDLLRLGWHIFGHIHESFGQEGIFVNASLCNAANKLTQAPVRLTI